METCHRGCLCGYPLRTAIFFSTIRPPTIDSPYDACDCNETLTDFYSSLATQSGLQSENAIPMPITKTNLSLLQYYGVIPCNASLASPGLTYASNIYGYTWVSILDGDNSTVLNPYECFGNLSTIQNIMNNYTSAQILQRAAGLVFDTYNYILPLQSACQCCGIDSAPDCVTCKVS